MPSKLTQDRNLTGTFSRTPCRSFCSTNVDASCNLSCSATSQVLRCHCMYNKAKIIRLRILIFSLATTESGDMDLEMYSSFHLLPKGLFSCRQNRNQRRHDGPSWHHGGQAKRRPAKAITSRPRRKFHLKILEFQTISFLAQLEA